MSRIVTTTYRPKRPPQKRKAVAIKAPAVVTLDPKTRAVKRVPTEEVAVVPDPVVSTEDDPAPANDDGPRKSAIVTARDRRADRWDRLTRRSQEGEPAGDAPEGDPAALGRWRKVIADKLKPR